MAIPPTATALQQPMDPSDVVDFLLTISRAGESDAPYPMLDTGEGVASYTLALTAEAVAAGLTIMNNTSANGTTYPPPTKTGLDVKFWLSVDASLQGSPLFDASGLTLALELTVVTNSTPPRKRQKTATVKVANQ